MRVGVPSEVKHHEYRVAATPSGVHELVGHGHDVLVQRGAGAGSSIPDEDYVAAGAKVLEHAEQVWGEADLVEDQAGRGCEGQAGPAALGGHRGLLVGRPILPDRCRGDKHRSQSGRVLTTERHVHGRP